MLSTVIFDIGNVFVPWDPRFLYEKIIDDKDELDFFLDNIVTLDWHKEHDRGLSFADGIEKRSAQFPEYADWIYLFDQRWPETIGEPCDQTVQLLEDLIERNIPCFALTNFSAEKFPAFKKRHAWTDFFSGIIVSGEEKVIKPDPRIFHITLDRFNLDPETVLFVDDRVENILAAEGLGMTGHIFKTPKNLGAVLKKTGFL